MVRVPYVKLNSVHWRTHYVKFPWLNFQSTNLNWSMVSISRNPPGIHGAQVANISRRVNKVERLAHFLHPNMASMGTGFFWMTFSGNIEKTASEILLGSPSTRWNMTALQNWEILYCLPRQYLDQHSAMLERNAVMPLGFPVNSRAGVSAVPWHPKASSVLLDMFKTCLENIKLLGCPT